MTFGIENENPSGRKVVTSSDTYLKLLAEGTVRSASSPWQTPHPSGAHSGPGFRITVPQPAGTLARRCFVFLQPKNRWLAPDARTHLVGVKNPFWYITDMPNEDFNYRIFYPDDGSVNFLEAQEQWGLELYDETGRKTFSTNQEIMKVLDIIKAEEVEIAPNWYDYNYSHAPCADAYYCLHVRSVRDKFVEFGLDRNDGYVYPYAMRQVSPTAVEFDYVMAMSVGDIPLGLTGPLSPPGVTPVPTLWAW